MATAETVGSDLVELCRAGKNMEAVERFYADDITSVEAQEGPGVPRQMSGKKAVKSKNQTWMENTQVNSAEVIGPYPHGNDKFAVHYRFDITNKKDGKRAQLDEVGVYQVANGKIVREEFFSRLA
jgi:hypothetical protein